MNFRNRLNAAYLRHSNLAFWMAFAVLNLLLFLPLFLLGGESQSSAQSASVGDWKSTLAGVFVWRSEVDPLRISIELTLLTALWVWVRQVQGWLFRVIVATVYLVALVYSIYEAVLSVWLLEPIFYSQIQLARDGLPYLLAHLGSGWWMAMGGLLALCLGIALILLLLDALFTSGATSRLSRASRVLIGAAALLCIATLVRYQYYTARPEMVTSSIGYKLERNFLASRQMRRDVLAFDDNVVQAAYDYAPAMLAKQPDIYLIFVESYGSVLYKRDDFRAAYTKLLAELEPELARDGWRSTTSLSISPTWGGGSWMAYTSAMLGVRVDNQPQYLSLLNKYQVDTFPSLGRTLHNQGYRFAWLSALDDSFSEVSWQRVGRFYGVDRLFRHDDLGYQGPGYGWGPAPPDEYTLNKTIETLHGESDQPLFLFTITQNSHYPWVPLPRIVDDWRTLVRSDADPANGVTAATPIDPDSIEHAERRQNYLHAVTYQLQMLARLIEAQGDDNSIFVLVGDHQPPVVSRRSDGWETPIHIISRDGALVDSFAQYGFAPGLQAASMSTTLHHEGIYSLLMRALTERYGVKTVALPAYLPTGPLPMHEARAVEEPIP